MWTIKIAHTIRAVVVEVDRRPLTGNPSLTFARQSNQTRKSGGDTFRGSAVFARGAIFLTQRIKLRQDGLLFFFNFLQVRQLDMTETAYALG